MNSLTPHQSKVLDTKGHISLTANAGSGKTFILAKRYIEIALENKINLRNIAAITFTDRAAGELYQKISKELEERITCTSSESLLHELQRIRRELVSANISTIHSFCISILKEYPMEAGVDADFIPVDENTSGELIDISIEEMVKASLENEDKEDIKGLIRLLGSKYTFTQELKSLIQNYRTIVLLNDKIYSSSEDKISEYLSNTFRDYRNLILSDKKAGILNAITIINDTVLEADEKNSKALSVKLFLSKVSADADTDDFLNSLNLIREFNCTKTGTICKQGYLKGALREDVEDVCVYVEEFYKTLDCFIRPEDYRERESILASIGKKIVTFVEKAFLLYEDKKFERGYLDYEDILLKTYYILQNENVRSELSGKFKYIMIDEYQDTNELQYRIFLPVIDFLKKGNLFIVGDEKQSIYMFRDADVAVFRKTKEDIENISGKDNLLVLPDSFRMKKEICFFTNTLFEMLFSAPNPVFNEVAHNNIICAKQDDGIPAKIEILLSEEDPDGVVISEAELVSSKILQLKNEGEAFGNIAVLCRKRRSFRELEEAFSEMEIPYNIIGGREFYQRQSIYDIYNYFSFMLSKEDDTALTGILRSPFFFLNDIEIYIISNHKGWTFWERLKEAASVSDKLKKIYATLTDNLSIAHTTEFICLLRKILSESGFLSVLAARPNGIQECANIEKLISLTSTFNAQGYKTLYDYVEFLKKSIDEVDNESQAVVTEGNDVVKIMTVHQSKGLEFNTVILYKCNEQTKNNLVKTKSLTADKEFGIITKFPQDNNYFTDYYTAPIAGLFNYICAKKNTAELKRLFYVGVTRAKSNLILSGEASTSDRYKEDSFFGLLQKGLGISFLDENVKLKGSIELLKADEDFQDEKVDIVIDIPVTKKLDKQDFTASEKSIELKSYKTDIIEGNPRDEIISATKFSTYSICPVKYYLLFEAGLIPLIDMNEVDTYDLRRTNPDNSFRRDTAALRGRIMHKLLELSLPEEELQQYITSLLKTEDFDEKQELEFTSEIISEINNIYKSSVYRELSAATEYRNEYEVYLKEKDFILFGRIDKVIFGQNRIRIIDYKTDNISKNDIENRGKKYLHQLKFYSYILARIFPEVAEFTVTILFSRHPGNPYNKTISRDELSATGVELEEMINSTRKGSYIRKNHHCSECSFFVNKMCLKDKI